MPMPAALRSQVALAAAVAVLAVGGTLAVTNLVAGAADGARDLNSPSAKVNSPSAVKVDSPSAVQADAHTITGSISFPAYHRSSEAWNVCYGTLSNSSLTDVREGTQVTVSDGANQIVAVGETHDYRRVDETVCAVKLTVTDVPERDFYSVTIGRKKGPTYTLADMKASGWKVSLE